MTLRSTIEALFTVGAVLLMLHCGLIILKWLLPTGTLSVDWYLVLESVKDILGALSAYCFAIYAVVAREYVKKQSP